MEPTNPTPNPAVKALAETAGTLDRAAATIDQWRLALEGMLANMTLTQDALLVRSADIRANLDTLGAGQGRQ